MESGVKLSALPLTYVFTLCLFRSQEDTQPAAAQGNLSLIDVCVCAAQQAAIL